MINIKTFSEIKHDIHPELSIMFNCPPIGYGGDGSSYPIHTTDAGYIVSSDDNRPLYIVKLDLSRHTPGMRSGFNKQEGQNKTEGMAITKSMIPYIQMGLSFKQLKKVMKFKNAIDRGKMGCKGPVMRGLSPVEETLDDMVNKYCETNTKHQKLVTTFDETFPIKVQEQIKAQAAHAHGAKSFRALKRKQRENVMVAALNQAREK